MDSKNSKDPNFFTCPKCNEKMPRLRKMDHINKECPKKERNDSGVPLFQKILIDILNNDAYKSHLENSKNSNEKIAELKNTEIVSKLREESNKIKKEDFDKRFSQSIKNPEEFKKEVEKSEEENIGLNMSSMMRVVKATVLLSKLPRGHIEDPDKLQLGDKSCFLCMENFIKDDKIIVLPCNHIFHEDHITNFLMKRLCCPICSFLGQLNILINAE